MISGEPAQEIPFDDNFEEEREEQYPVEDSLARVLMRWLFGLLSVLSLAAVFALGAFVQLSDEGPAKSVLARAMTHLSQIDYLLSGDYYERVQELATAAQSGGEDVVLPELPVRLTLSPEELTGLDVAELRRVILGVSADRLYEDGLDAFREGEPPAPKPAGLLSAQGAIDFTIGNLNRETHDRARYLLSIGMVVAALSVTLFLLLGRGLWRIAMLGLVVTLAAGLSLAATLAARILLSTIVSADGDPFMEGLQGVAREAASVPIRNFTIFLILGLVTILIGLAVSGLGRRLQPERWGA